MSDILNDVYKDLTYRYRMDASTLLAKSSDSIGMLKAVGWDVDVLKCHSGSRDVPQFGVLHREIQLPPVAQTLPTEPDNHTEKQKTAAQCSGVKFSPSDIPSIKMLRKDDVRFVVALDTEFYYPRPTSFERLVLTWQLCFSVPGKEDVLHEVVFYSLLGRRLTVEQALAYVIGRFHIAAAMVATGATKCPDRGYKYAPTRVWTVPTHDTKGALWKDRRRNGSKWEACKTFAAAQAKCGDPEFSKAYADLAASHKRPSQVRLKRSSSGGDSLAGYTNDYRPYHLNRADIPVTILCHFGRADLTTFAKGRYGADLMLMTSQVQRGHVTLESFPAEASLPDAHWRFYPLDVQVRDTMCMAPAKSRSLALLGESIGIPKLDLPKGYDKARMDQFLRCDPVSFMDYAAQDALVTLMYATALFGTNRDLPVTASSAGVSAVIRIIGDEYGLAAHLQNTLVVLSGDPKVWEAKHEQDEFLNITTRGNCAPEDGGVCAMNGYSTPFSHDSRGARRRKRSVPLPPRRRKNEGVI